MPYSEQYCFTPEPAPCPLIGGTLTGRVGSDEKNAPYAHLNETGRCRVNLDFNREDTRELHDDELRSKVKDRTIINAARIEQQSTTGSEQ